MGTPKSIAWDGKVAAGRAAVEQGKTEGIAYFEWSAAPGVDVLNPELWWSWMPALGHTITPRVIQHELDLALATNTLSEWMRAYGNIPTGSAERVIPAVDWDIVNSPDAFVPYDEARCFSVDCNPERTWAGITVAGADTIEVIDRQPGTGWVVARAVELQKNRKLPWAIEASGPAGSFIPAFEEAGIEVIKLGPRDVSAAAGYLYDAVVNHTVRIRRWPELDEAVESAARRPSGDAWAWGRKVSTGDISLLVAATNALWCANVAVKHKPVFAF
jgi:hypothetical protein